MNLAQRARLELAIDAHLRRERNGMARQVHALVIGGPPDTTKPDHRFAGWDLPYDLVLFPRSTMARIRRRRRATYRAHR